jgi:hypothetical protein
MKGDVRTKAREIRPLKGAITDGSHDIYFPLRNYSASGQLRNQHRPRMIPRMTNTMTTIPWVCRTVPMNSLPGRFRSPG